MRPYNRKPDSSLYVNGVEIASFQAEEGGNLDQQTVDSFGEEWSAFDSFDEAEIATIGDEYFDVVSESIYGEEKVALDVGCGSGRWSLYAAKKFGFVEAVDPSKAVLTAAANAKGLNNIRISQAGVDNIPFEDESFDFVFSLGVLHHIPNTAEAMKACVKKLKSGGYFLVYLYYSLDNRGSAYKLLFKASNSIRWFISKMPANIKKILCDLIAALVYFPLVMLARLVKTVGFKSWKKLPLSYYANKSFFVIRNDALDRFGTPLEQRFSKKEINQMMRDSGLVDITFSNKTPYWHAVGKKV